MADAWLVSSKRRNDEHSMVSVSNKQEQPEHTTMKVRDEGVNLLSPVGKQEGPVPAMALSVNKSIPDNSGKYIGVLNMIHNQVARQMHMSEADIIPAAMKAMESEWKALADMKCWGTDAVQEHGIVFNHATAQPNGAFWESVPHITREDSCNYC